jgi:hypothetical protein
VAVSASVLKRAAISVGLGFLLGAPDHALVGRVVVDVHFPTEVLPVVGVDTGIAGMILIFFVAERAPDSFKVEQIEVNVLFHPVQVVDRQFIFMVSERAHLAELALVQIVRVRLAEFGLVLLWVVEVFDCVVSTVAVISEWAVVSIVAESRCVGAKRTASVFHAYIVVEETAFGVVGSLEIAWQGFESIEIKEHDAFMIDGLL